MVEHSEATTLQSQVQPLADRHQKGQPLRAGPAEARSYNTPHWQSHWNTWETSQTGSTWGMGAHLHRAHCLMILSLSSVEDTERTWTNVVLVPSSASAQHPFTGLPLYPLCKMQLPSPETVLTRVYVMDPTRQIQRDCEGNAFCCRSFSSTRSGKSRRCSCPYRPRGKPSYLSESTVVHRL